MIEKAFNAVKDQSGPCGIACGTCVLGTGKIAKSAKQTNDYINNYGVKEWAPEVPGGAELKWDEVNKALEWVSKYAFCVGCEKNGGRPDCPIRNCANEKGFKLCNDCDALGLCDNFEWLNEFGENLKTQLEANKGMSKKEWIVEAIKDIN